MMLGKLNRLEGYERKMGRCFGTKRERFYGIFKQCWAKLERGQLLKWIWEGIIHILNLEILERYYIRLKTESIFRRYKFFLSSTDVPVSLSLRSKQVTDVLE